MRALTVGGATIDTIAIIESDRIERMSMRNADSAFLLLEEGRKTESLEISTHCGGGATNAAVALARLGFEVAALIKLGTDRRAETILDKLKEEGVSARWVKRDARAPTGASVLVSSHERNAAVFTFRGANALLELEDLSKEAFEVDLVHVANLSNRSAECYPAIVEKAKAQGAFLSTNPGLRQLSAHAPEFLQCLPSIDVLTLNRQEADALVAALTSKFGEDGGRPGASWGHGPPRLAIRGLIGGGFEMSLRVFFGRMLERGVRHVVVTDGSEGAFAASGTEIFYAEARKMAVAGTAGAGDAFAATYAACVARGQPAADALTAATVNAASVLGHVDTQSGLLTRKALETELEAIKSRPGVMSWPL
jgi:ribokinase